MIGVYQPGDSPLHRLPASAKLAALLVLGIALAVIPGWPSAVAALVVSVLIAAVSGMRFAVMLRRMLGLALVVGTLAGYLTWQHGWERAVGVVGDLLALALLATVVTATTPVDAVLDAVARAVRPLARIGVNPEQVALAFSLVLRGIPTTLEIADETRMAARARGLQRDPRALLSPMVIRTVAHARATGEALHARGVLD
ncbi:energy-coupling factor transporter transmembrane component T family protein [Cumulibacter manganitolerans]|uniref:energy-coupling factor transporter transmembrane component T family protein n=1 Tax=Cumulibacter manganitolerans TaxID=1884992 RepID=UPI00129822E7|nr:energy-coupling factor transporter transmembrane protein EcfT [Cumulibacter manganitolerans]